MAGSGSEYSRRAMRRSVTAVACAVAASALAVAVLPALAADHVVRLAADHVVRAKSSNTFEPKSISIQVGDTVTWGNDGGFHNVRFEGASSGTPPTPEPPNGPGWTANPPKRTFSTAGQFRYYCEAHASSPTSGGMTGVVVVGGAGGGPPGGGGGGGEPAPGGGTVGDAEKPRISSFRVNPASFCTRRSRTCRRTGARLRFTLSEDADLSVRIDRLRPRLSPGIRTLELDGRNKGRNTVRFAGSGLKAGRYRVLVTAKDAAGNQSAPVRRTFTIRG